MKIFKGIYKRTLVSHKNTFRGTKISQTPTNYVYGCMFPYPKATFVKIVVVMKNVEIKELSVDCERKKKKKKSLEYEKS